MQQNNGNLFRRLAATAVGVATLVSLAACSKAPAEPTLPSHLIITEPAATRPQDPTEPPIAETVPIQPTETTAPKVEIDYDNLVTDAYCNAILDGDGYKHCYHIPQFNLHGNSAQQINKRIYNQCNRILDEVYSSIYEYGWAESMQVVYTWGYRNDLASVLISNQFDWGGVDYYVYTTSVTTGQEASINELLAVFDMDREEFYDLVHDRLKQYWDERSELRTPSGDEFFDECVRRTLSDANVYQAIPYINSNGGLSFVANIYSVAGADSYLHLINAEGEIEADYLECTQKHTYSSLVSMDDPLEYFIENCGRMYFTKADIQSFDEEMCLYARNAIYAKSGWIFNDDNLKNYFSKYTWYHPTISPESFTEDLLNSYQIANRYLIVNHENTLKSADLDPLQYISENCDRRYFSASEISGLSKDELQYARNAIYAKSGRIFSMEKLASYFAKYSWYNPHIPGDAFQEDMLNSYQTANRDLIVARENELNGITAEEAYAIACRYWDYHEGDIADESGFPLYVVDDGTIEHNGTMYYSFRLRWMVTDENGSSWMSTLDQVYINSKNGECTYTIYS